MRQWSRPARRVQPPHPALDVLDDGFCMLDADWRITYWNPAAERLLGLTRREALGAVLWELMPSLRESESWDNLWAVRMAGAPRRYTERHSSPKRRGYISVHAAAVEDGGLAVHFRDAMEDVERSREYAGLLESIRDGFVAVDEKWQIVYLNAAAESLLRLPREQARGVPIWTLLPRGPAEIEECLRATLEDGIQRHLREVRPEGRVFRGRVFDLWTHPLASGGLSILFEDVSERVRHEKELARLATEAQEANQAKSRFFAAISHELRTPLNAIVGYTHLLHSGTYGEMPSHASRAAQRASVCAEHLSRLVDDVLLMTTAEIGRLTVSPSTIVLQEYLPALCEPHRHQAEAKGLEFEIGTPADLPYLETDPQRLRQLVSALLTNAVKFTSRGRIRVDARLAGGDGLSGVGELGEYTLFPERQLEIRVVDSGPGVAPENRERIFGPFEQIGDPARSDSMVRGTGLGLAVARRLAVLLHGGLFLTATSAAGSEFCLRLPVDFPHRRT